ncbi:MAG: ABC transporter ATP-binding protein [Planctomycetes bacterium]|nr:ABC transporter ATP-binding protein [Planctomycetota bacterium]
MDLEVHPGEFVSLLGPSGCGKTTSLRLIAGFDHPTSGDVYIHGHLVNGSPPYRRDVNMVFQSYALFPHLTVRANVSFGLEMQRLLRPEIESRVDEALGMVRMEGLSERYPHQLSGGQQQRAALARALVTRPAVLLLDEPLGALDLRLRQEMQGELKKLQRRLGLAFLYVTHDQEEALTMSDRVAVMQGGRILQCGTPAEVYEKPRTRFVAEFVGEANILSGRVIGLGEGSASVGTAGGVVRVSDAGGTAQTGREVTMVLRPEKVVLSEASASGHDNRLSGLVEEVTYLGNGTRYRVRVGDRLALTVRRQNAPHERAVGLGEKVFACFPADTVHLLTEE